MTTEQLDKLDRAYTKASIGLLDLRELLNATGYIPLANEIEAIERALAYRASSLKDIAAKEPTGR